MKAIKALLKKLINEEINRLEERSPLEPADVGAETRPSAIDQERKRRATASFGAETEEEKCKRFAGTWNPLTNKCMLPRAAKGKGAAGGPRKGVVLKIQQLLNKYHMTDTWLRDKCKSRRCRKLNGADGIWGKNTFNALRYALKSENTALAHDFIKDKRTARKNLNKLYRILRSLVREVAPAAAAEKEGRATVDTFFGRNK